MTSPEKPRRPRFVDSARLEVLADRSDPIAVLHAAHETAAVLVGAGRASSDPAVVERLVAVVDSVGLSTLAELWAGRPATSLPGALWRLYVLREWIRLYPDEVAREYAWGMSFTEAHHVVAGVDPPGRDEVVEVADAILRGVFAGDVAVAFERAAAFCHVVVAGRAYANSGEEAALSAAKLRDLADDLVACAQLWRAGELV